jgi:DNA-binding protein YbaB
MFGNASDFGAKAYENHCLHRVLTLLNTPALGNAIKALDGDARTLSHTDIQLALNPANMVASPNQNTFCDMASPNANMLIALPTMDKANPVMLHSRAVRYGFELLAQKDKNTGVSTFDVLSNLSYEDTQVQSGKGQPPTTVDKLIDPSQLRTMSDKDLSRAFQLVTQPKVITADPTGLSDLCRVAANNAYQQMEKIGAIKAPKVGEKRAQIDPNRYSFFDLHNPFSPYAKAQQTLMFGEKNYKYALNGLDNNPNTQTVAKLWAESNDHIAGRPETMLKTILKENKGLPETIKAPEPPEDADMTALNWYKKPATTEKPEAKPELKPAPKITDPKSTELDGIPDTEYGDGTVHVEPLEAAKPPGDQLNSKSQTNPFESYPLAPQAPNDQQEIDVQDTLKACLKGTLLLAMLKNGLDSVTDSPASGDKADQSEQKVQPAVVKEALLARAREMTPALRSRIKLVQQAPELAKFTDLQNKLSEMLKHLENDSKAFDIAHEKVFLANPVRKAAHEAMTHAAEHKEKLVEAAMAMDDLEAPDDSADPNTKAMYMLKKDAARDVKPTQFLPWLPPGFPPMTAPGATIPSPQPSQQGAPLVEPGVASVPDPIYAPSTAEKSSALGSQSSTQRPAWQSDAVAV